MAYFFVKLAKNYVYIPLGGNKRGFLKTNINVMVTMILGGLWHGPSWNFVLWGFFHGFYLVMNNILLKIKIFNNFKETN